MQIKKSILLLILANATLLNAAALPDNPRQVIAVRTEGTITIDGILDEAVWLTKGFSGFIQSDPADGEKATEKTIVWVAFDKQNLYVAARLLDSQPDQIISRLGRRDDEVDSDWFTFAVDPYFDKRSGFQFAINPAGSIMDSTLFNDEGKDTTWDGVWYSAVNIDATGWTLELKIPFHQLRFKERDKYTWGVNFIRMIKRKNERVYFSWIPKEESGYVSRFAEMTGISSIDPGRVLEFLPYTVAKAAFSPEQQGNPYRTGKDFSGNMGLDFKAGLRSNLTLNVTANPDFGEVEVDPAVINISDQETYYTEKRPFFIEGADIFRFGYGGTNSLANFGWSDPSFFYSRRIGRSPQGYAPGPGYTDYPDWTTILSAAKLTGKLGDSWNLGLLSALTQREYAEVDQNGQRTRHEVEPFSHYSVLRAQKEFNNGHQGLGFITTSVLRDLRNDVLAEGLTDRAFSLAIDGWAFLDKDRTWVITGWLGGTRVSGSQAVITRMQNSSLHYYQRPDADHVELDPDATSLSGWAGRLFLNKQKGNILFNAALGAISPGFNAMDIGYHSRGDKINGHLEAGYQVFHPGRIFRSWTVSLASHLSYDFGGNRIDECYYFSASGSFLNYWKGLLILSYDPTRFNHYLTRGGPMALYPWGIMRRLIVSSDNRKPVVFTLSAHYRTHPYGAYNYSFNFGVRWKPSDNFSLSISPGYSWRHSVGQFVAAVDDKYKIETFGIRYVMSDIIQETLPMVVRINWTFSPKLSLQVYLQPFIGVGDFQKFKELVAPRTFDFFFYGEGDSIISLENNTYTVDPDGPGPSAPFSFRNPDFNLKSLRGTIVLRWEYRPGSAIYAVWTQNRADYSNPGDFQIGRDVHDLFSAAGDNVFLFKFNYRFTL